MINEFEVPAVIKDEVPEIEVSEADNKGSVYKNMQLLTQYTNTKILEHNYNAVKKSFAIADRLYNKGNNIVKNAVENVYIFSFTHMLNICGKERERILSIIPIALYTAYIHQLHTTGC